MPATFEITYDPKEHAAESFLLLDEDHEIIPSFPWLEWLQRHLEDPRLFVYRHRLTGRYELCQWIFPPWEGDRPVAQELEGFSSDPRLGWPPDLMAPEVLCARLAPIDEIVTARRRADRDAAAKLLRDKHDRHEVRRRATARLRKMGLEREARAMENGEVPVALPSKDSATFDTLRSLLKRS